MLLEICAVLLGCSIYWHLTIIFSYDFYSSVVSVIASPLSFLILFIWLLSLFFLVRLTKIYVLCVLQLIICFLHYVGEVFTHNLFKYIFDSFLSLSPPSGILIMSIACFILSYRSPMLLSFLICLFVCCSD